MQKPDAETWNRMSGHQQWAWIVQDVIQNKRRARPPPNWTTNCDSEHFRDPAYPTTLSHTLFFNWLRGPAACDAATPNSSPSRPNGAAAELREPLAPRGGMDAGSSKRHRRS